MESFPINFFEHIGLFYRIQMTFGREYVFDLALIVQIVLSVEGLIVLIETIIDIIETLCNSNLDLTKYKYLIVSLRKKLSIRSSKDLSKTS